MDAFEIASKGKTPGGRPLSAPRGKGRSSEARETCFTGGTQGSTLRVAITFMVTGDFDAPNSYAFLITIGTCNAQGFAGDPRKSPICHTIHYKGGNLC